MYNLLHFKRTEHAKKGGGQKNGLHGEERMELKAQKDKPLTKHRVSKSGLTKTDGGIDGLHQLAASFGAATSYIDEGGVRRQVTAQSLRRILAVMGVQVETPEQVRMSLRESRSRRWRELVDPVTVVRVDRLPDTFAVRLPVNLDELRRLRFVWRLKRERGGATTKRASGGQLKVVSRTIVDGVGYQEFARLRRQALVGTCSFCRFTLQWQPGSL